MRKSWPHADLASQVAYLDLVVRLSEYMLLRLDKVTMSLGLEAREPFMDYRLVEYVFRLPTRLKVQHGMGKYVLKRAMGDLLPPAVLERTKRGFPSPLYQWFRSGLMPYARATILGSRLRERGLFRYDQIEAMLNAHEREGSDHGKVIWPLLVFSAWYDQWISKVSQIQSVQ
jgi:asparagine synthase (glutamine-hydrolysing)